MNLKFLFNSGKNSNLKYYLNNYARYCIPNNYFIKNLDSDLRKLDDRPDKTEILERVDYYNKLTEITELPADSLKLGDHILKNCKRNKAYFFDTYEYVRRFDKELKWQYRFGDITSIPPYPAIVKSRPIGEGNTNSVLMKLNKVRHYVFVKDKTKWSDKKDMAVFRGMVDGKPNRIRFMETFMDHPMCDLGDVDTRPLQPDEWKRPMMTIYDHLKYKFVLALEGNDVATNLKWILSSNSLAVMPQPTFETWFMEGRLIPNYHYVEIKPDFSDFEERIRYYIDRPEEAEAIIRHGNEYVKQFMDPDKEKLISLLVMEKYFEKTGQLK